MGCSNTSLPSATRTLRSVGSSSRWHSQDSPTLSPCNYRVLDEVGIAYDRSTSTSQSNSSPCIGARSRPKTSSSSALCITISRRILQPAVFLQVRCCRRVTGTTPGVYCASPQVTESQNKNKKNIQITRRVTSSYRIRRLCLCTSSGTCLRVARMM